MLTDRELRALADTAFAASAADQTEVVVREVDAALTRFANNSIHQNVAERNVEFTVRAVVGRRLGVATGNDLSPGGIRRVVERASILAQHSPELPDFQSLPRPQPLPSNDGWSETTAASSPEARARFALPVCRRAAEAGFVASGYVEIRAEQITVANSLGLFASTRRTSAGAMAVVQGDGGSGYADRFARDAAQIDPMELAEEALGRARRSRNPIEVAPGEYDVVLEPYAVADILSALSFLGFGARSVQDQTSFLSGRFGERVMGENISIWDDPRGEEVIPEPFDPEGVPSRRVDLIVKGVAAGVVYDTLTASRAGKESTGHALPPGSTFGPLARHLYLAPGTDDDLVRAVDRGLLVTRFWYTRPVHPLTVTMTGMTRDGVFLIERGEVVAAVKNLRFTHSYLAALNAVTGISRRTKLEIDEINTVVPRLRVAGWRFTSATAH
ncbi:MAG: TldD/PmbA family protein [Chloroflexota bacterium]|nr:TldD/PmbA family protein [Dehalococcoidia bacterium]MDW8254294.1 TldD/PmbA family protein [Chloroflexota bacterium]